MATDPRLEESRKQREADWQAGLSRGKELFGEGSLGRLGESEDIKTVLARRRAGLEGMSPQEKDMMRAQMMSAINRGAQGSLRQLRGIQGQAGVRGAAAGAQAADILKGAQQAGIGAERDIGMANLLARRQALDSLERTATGVGTFDIGQAAKEKYGQYSSGLAEQMLGAQERGALTSADIYSAQARAQAERGKKG